MVLSEKWTCKPENAPCSVGVSTVAMSADPNRLLKNTGFPFEYEDDRLFGSGCVEIAQRGLPTNVIYQPSVPSLCHGTFSSFLAFDTGRSE